MGLVDCYLLKGLLHVEHYDTFLNFFKNYMKNLITNTVCTLHLFPTID